MVLALLHLSDMHLAGNRSTCLPGRVPQVVAALRSAYPLIDHCLVLVSGDIGYSGRSEEYREALEFISLLKDELARHFAGTRVLTVPGNHDCDFRNESDLRKLVIESIQSQVDHLDEKGKTLRELLDVESSFFEFEAQLGENRSSLVGPWIVRDEVLEIGGERIRVIRLNTAFMSQIQERGATLFFPVHIASRYFAAPMEASLVVSVFHHPYSWLESANADGLKKLIEARTDVILTGHEHIQDAYTKELMSGQRLEYVQGAVLESRDSPASGFNVVLCDLENKTQRIVEFKWSDDRYTSSVERGWKPFVRNDALRRRFDKNPIFTKYLEAVGTGFIHPRRPDLRLDDIFVYPDLQKLSLEKGAGRKDVALLVPSSDVPAFISRTKYLLLIGSDHSGRSALTRKIFRDLDGKGFVPLLLRGKELKAKTVDGFLRVVDEAYAEQYSASSLEAFKQLDSEKKALIVDDWHHTRFGKTAKKQIVDAAKRIFGRVVVVAGDMFRIEEIAARKQEGHPFVGFEHCEIKAFSNVLRGRLIEKWISLDHEGSGEDPGLAREIEHAEKTVRTLLGKQLLPSYPFIILTLLQASEAAKDTSAPAGSYGYLYEFIITKAIARVSKDLTIVDLHYVLLSRLAFYLFEGDKKRFTRTDMQQVVEDYHREYDIPLNTDRLLEEFESADLIVTSNGNFEFRYKYTYYYFVARYIRDAMRTEGRRVDFDRRLADMADRVYYDEYMNILMFVLYLTKDEKLISHILRRAEEIYAGSEACDFEGHIQFINKLFTEKPKMILPSASYEEARERQRQGMDEEDIEPIADSSEPEGKDVAYREDLEDIVKLNIAFKTLQLMGQILRNFPGSLEKDVKLKLTRSCYLLGLRSLRAILSLAERNLDDFRNYVADIIREYKSALTEEELARTADEAVIWLTRRCGFAVVKRISYSVGLEILAETYRKVAEKAEPARPFQIIDLAIKLDHFRAFPYEDLKAIWSKSGKNYFFQTLLRDLVGNYLYLMPLDDRTKQSVCNLLDIKFQRRLPSG